MKNIIRRRVLWGFLVLAVSVHLLSDQSPGRSRPGLSRIRHISSLSYTRVVMDLTAEIRYRTQFLEKVSSQDLPPRIYVDLLGAKLGKQASRRIIVRDRMLKQIRAGQFRSDVVRVVLDMKDAGNHKAFLLPGPYRLVVDIQSKKNGMEMAGLVKNRSPKGKPKKNLPPFSIRKIVLDPGHGGADPGAIGPRGIAEKDVVLQIAKKLARKLSAGMGVKTILTRKGDYFVPLEDRTAMANAENADLFISLHTNASSKGRMRGVESYYLDNTTDEAAVRLAARENGTSRRNISDLQFILSDLVQNSKLEDSIGLAHHIQSSLVSHMKRKRPRVKDLGVKKGLFYVLVGARMPSVLVEMFFITNKAEGRALSRGSFQNAIVNALYRGISRYRESTRTASNL